MLIFSLTPCRINCLLICKVPQELVAREAAGHACLQFWRGDSRRTETSSSSKENRGAPLRLLKHRRVGPNSSFCKIEKL